MTTEIKPCPYCGNARTGDAISGAVYVEAENVSYVVCSECQALGPEADTNVDAIAAWNRVASMAEALDHPLLRELFGEIEDSGTKEATRLWSLVAQWLEVRRAAACFPPTTQAEG